MPLNGWVSTHALPRADAAYWRLPDPRYKFMDALEADEADGLSLGQEVYVPYGDLGGFDLYTLERLAINVEGPDGRPTTVLALRNKNDESKLDFGVARRKEVDLIAAPKPAEEKMAA